jgi:16S rRNA (guanine966-N2)-methyltransferase
MMQMIMADLAGARMLDLFAGSGAIGLEAISRGGRYCDFVENGPPAIHSLKANIAALRVREKCRVYDRDAIPWVERLQPDRYDIAFADPPYGSRKLDRVLAYWREVPFSRVLVLEHAADQDGVPAAPPPGMTLEQRRMDETVITVLRAERQVAPDGEPQP